MRGAVWFVLIAMPAVALAQSAPKSPEPVDPWPPEPPPAPPPEPIPPPPDEDTAPTPPEPAPRSPDRIDPSEVPIDLPPPVPPYPRSFVDRPVVLPRGMRLVSFGASVGRETVQNYRLDAAGTHIGGAFGVGGIELGAGVDLMILHDDNRDPTIDATDDVPVFQRAHVGVTLPLPAETYVDVDAVIGNVGTDFQRYSPSLLIGHKFRPSESGAVFVSVGADYNYGNDITYYDERFVYHRFGAYAGGTARIQASPAVALQVRGSISQFRYVDDYHYSNNDSFRGIAGGGAVLISASQTVDVSASLSASTVGALDDYGAGVSVTIRSR